MISAATPIAKPLLGLVVLTTVGGGAVLWHKHKPLAVPAGPGTGLAAMRETDPVRERQLIELSDRITALKNELAQLKQAQNQKPTPLQAPAQAPVVEPEPPSAEEAERQEEQANVAIEAQQNRLDQTLAVERADPEWSKEAAASWTQVFQKERVKEELKDLQLGNIECRTSLCRVELTPTDPEASTEAFEQGFRKFMLFAPWEAPGFGKIENPDGQGPIAVFYLAREGHALP